MSCDTLPISCEFLLDGAARRPFAAALQQDIVAARLSPAFRAYYQLRSLIPLAVRQMLQRYRHVEASPRWCFPEEFVNTLANYLATVPEGLPIIHPWPEGANHAIVLTHDVETAAGMRNILRIADLEEELGYRSSWNVVPYKYAIDDGIISELQSRGFEVGIHGYNHDGKLFSSRKVFAARVPAINVAIDKYNAVGFRSPMVHRNLEWLQALNIEYDASYFDVDPYQAMPGGIGSIWPFLAGRFVELPYTLPQDHTLFVALNESNGSLWRQKLHYLRALGGMALLVTHPDYLDSEHRLNVYRRFLIESRAESDGWCALPREVARWWRSRADSTIESTPSGRLHIVGPAADRGRLARLESDPHAEGQIGWQFAELSPAASALV